MKIKRDAFLYLEPKNINRWQFAQCATCAFWGRDTFRCKVMDISADADDTCGFYLEGAEIDMAPRQLVDRFESGFEERAVRCENCKFAYKGRCHLYLQLNSMFPDIFDLDPKISPYGCCNANIAKDQT